MKWLTCTSLQRITMEREKMIAVQTTLMWTVRMHKSALHYNNKIIATRTYDCIKLG